ncbi:MAG: PspC domain-containing protein [Lagierella massiliensis]|nr:PspC domain-containing protein [Lagierella massiliensis]
MQKKLYKVREGRMIQGVCLGLSEYFGVDVSIVRIITAVFGLFYFTGVVAYIVAAIVLPWKEDIYPSDKNFKDNSYKENGFDDDYIDIE